MERLLFEMWKKNLPALLITRPVNVKYVSRYTGDDSCLLLTENNKYFITDPRYTEQAGQECPDYQIVEWRSQGSRAAAIARILEDEGITELGYEETYLTVADYRALEKAVKADFIPADGMVEALRACKTPEELACLRISCDIASRAFDRILKDIRVGITEKELAAKLSMYMVMEGADTQPYGNILISGARTSLLHGIPSQKAVEYGDLVLMDYGCQYHGYLSDMTRTVVVGRATPKQREVYALEQQMVADMEGALKGGMTGQEMYQISTKAIAQTEYFPYHYNGIGHGIGMFVHEIPFISPTSEDIIQPGTVMTVEPGIYIPGWGGIRIEDQLLVTEEGCENLISAPKELIEL